MEKSETLVFDIEKFSVQDGPGIRSVVFLKGCPLHCLWCHNPESQSFQKEIMFSERLCIYCGGCQSVCPEHCHSITENNHLFHRKNCIFCGKCTEKCYSAALGICGKEMSVDEVLTEVMKDKLFYDNSGGGVTLSGGEPLAHPVFTEDFLKKAKDSGLHTAVETSGFAAVHSIEKIFPLVDLLLWDIKALPSQYKDLTGADWNIVAENLHFISEHGGSIVLRCPMIPGINDSEENLNFIAALATSTSGVKQVDLEPYHPLGTEKRCKLGKGNQFAAEMYGKGELEIKAEQLRNLTDIPVSVFTI